MGTRSDTAKVTPRRRTQNSPKTATPRQRKARFKKGQSGNPGGRPKGVATMAREKVGNDPSRLLDVFLEIAEKTDAKDADRVAAAREYLNRGWGQSPAFVAIEGGDPLELGDLDQAITDSAAEVVELARVREAATAGEVERGRLEAAS